MGYFSYFVKCVIRKIVNFIFRKDNFFKFCCILFFVFCITKLFLQTPISYGATTSIEDTTYYDGYLANKNLMDKLQADLVTRLTNCEQTELRDELLTYLNNSEYSVFTYYGEVQGSASNINALPANTMYLNIIIAKNDNYNRTITYQNWNNNGDIACGSITFKGDFFRFAFIDNTLVYRENTPTNFLFYYPSYLTNYRSEFFTSYIINYFKISSDDIGEIIQNTTNTIIESNQQVQNSVQEQTNTIKQQQEFLTSNTVSDDSFVLPEDDTNDTTGVDDEINFIFDDIMNKFTDTSSNNSITLTFPFTNQTFDISYASVYNGVFERNNSMAYLKRIIQLGYWYIIAVFVVKDISNKVNKVKTGDIDKIQTGNIKEDLL